MSEERRKILDMLAQGKITVEEAEKLLNAVTSDEYQEASPSSDKGTTGKPGFKYLRVQVQPGPGSEKQEKVDIRVPAKLIRAGLKWAAFMPKHAQKQVNQALHEKGVEIELDKITSADIEELLIHLNDLTVNVEGKETVKIFCE